MRILFTLIFFALVSLAGIKAQAETESKGGFTTADTVMMGNLTNGSVRFVGKDGYGYWIGHLTNYGTLRVIMQEPNGSFTLANSPNSGMIFIAFSKTQNQIANRNLLTSNQNSYLDFMSRRPTAIPTPLSPKSQTASGSCSAS